MRGDASLDVPLLLTSSTVLIIIIFIVILIEYLELKLLKKETDFKLLPIVPFFVMCGVQGEPNDDVCFASRSSFISSLFTGGNVQCHWENNAIL